jgi:hypothetical protein
MNEALQAANHKRHVLGLIRKHGLTGARRELGDKAPCLQTLKKQAVEAGIEIPGRGRPSVYKKEKIVKLLAKFQSHRKVRAYLKERNLACPTNPMLVKWASEAGIVITRGRPVEKAAA